MKYLPRDFHDWRLLGGILAMTVVVVQLLPVFAVFAAITLVWRLFAGPPPQTSPPPRQSPDSAVFRVFMPKEDGT